MFDLNSLRLADLADVLIVSLCVYAGLRWIQTTASRGLAIAATALIVVDVLAEQFDLHLTTQLFRFGLTIGAVVLVVVFQDEIRRAVERAALNSRWRKRNSGTATQPHLETLLQTTFDLAGVRRGALIVLAGDEPLDSHLDGGTELVGRISQPLLESLFDPHSAGHDGAVIIDEGFVTRFGVHLPLSENRERSAGLGTRHRSGLGLSELSDALVVIVSEERGQVSIARHGELNRGVSKEELSAALSQHLADVHVESRPGILKLMGRHPRTRIMAFLISLLAWLLVASDRHVVQRMFVVPIEYRNVPADFDLPDSIRTEARVTFSATDRAFQFVAPSALKVSVDLSEAAHGKTQFALTESSVRHPATLTVYRIEPRMIQLQ